ncbi:PREDICTED: uncharacterized protein LOC108513096 isoform X3 [Rhinopithecus bieti]|uniref:uncharacterized protein LOC108513096 isoform X3 n=1 Tax=Rhinopithecus bieti TaxID=61621 RepID=UPI00083C76F9|nr:PREDICTED: uncharacterized protein LOC108513096 isoform X3 [Rhinopithecus bieti]
MTKHEASILGRGRPDYNLSQHEQGVARSTEGGSRAVPASLCILGAVVSSPLLPVVSSASGLQSQYSPGSGAGRSSRGRSEAPRSWPGKLETVSLNGSLPLGGKAAGLESQQATCEEAGNPGGLGKAVWTSTLPQRCWLLIAGTSLPWEASSWRY